LIHFYRDQISDQTALSTDRRTPRRLHVFPWSSLTLTTFVSRMTFESPGECDRPTCGQPFDR
jgi:hypothetical protein